MADCEVSGWLGAAVRWGPILLMADLMVEWFQSSSDPWDDPPNEKAMLLPTASMRHRSQFQEPVWIWLRSVSDMFEERVLVFCKLRSLGI